MHGVTLRSNFRMHALLPVCNLCAVHLVLLHRDDREQCIAPDGPVPLDVVSDRSEDERAHRLRRLQVLSIITKRPMPCHRRSNCSRGRQASTSRAVHFAGADPGIIPVTSCSLARDRLRGALWLLETLSAPAPPFPSPRKCCRS